MADIVLLSKTDIFSRKAQQYAAQAFGPRLAIADGAVGDPRPSALTETGRILISFLSPWIITAEELARFDVAINFHPGSVDYPGTGCYNFALYDGAGEFGATCHHMLPKVDTGLVVEERRFPTLAADTVETLKLRTMYTMLTMFEGIVDLIARGEPLPAADTHWTRNAYTRREMNALKELRPTMAPAEIERRVRATTYPGYDGPYMVQGGETIRYPVPDRPPLA